MRRAVEFKDMSTGEVLEGTLVDIKMVCGGSIHNVESYGIIEYGDEFITTVLSNIRIKKFPDLGDEQVEQLFSSPPNPLENLVDREVTLKTFDKKTLVQGRLLVSCLNPIEYVVRGEGNARYFFKEFSVVDEDKREIYLKKEN